MEHSRNNRGQINGHSARVANDDNDAFQVSSICAILLMYYQGRQQSHMQCWQEQSTTVASAAMALMVATRTASG